MTKDTVAQQPKQGPAQPYPADEVNKQKQHQQANEVAGKHKNDGQKDHKGAR